MLILSMMCLILLSCRSLEPTISGTHNLSLIAHTSHHDTVLLRDSVFISERQRGDTVYLTRTEWRDRWRTRIERDTVVDVRIEKEVVQLPPQRYVPKFYKHCTTYFWGIVVLFLLYIVFRLTKSKLLQF